MTARHLIIIFLVSTVSISFAQENNNNIETTKQLLKEIKKYKNTNPDSFKILIDSTKKYINLIDDNTLKSKYYNEIATSHYTKWELDSSYYYLLKALSYSIQTTDSSLIAKDYSNMGLILNQFDSTENALIYIHKSIKLYTKIKNEEKNLAKVYLDLSQAYLKVSNYLKASIYLEYSDSIFLSIGDSTKLKYTRLTMGTTYKQLNMLEEALFMYNSALQLNKDFPTNDISAYIYSNFTELYCTEYYQLDSALKYSKLAIKACNKLGQHYLLPSIYINLCGVYSKEGEHEKIIETIYPYINDKRTEVRAASFINIGYAMVILKNDSAEYYLLEGIKIAKEFDMLSYLSRGYKNLSFHYADNNSYKEAYKYRLKYNTIADSIHNLKTFNETKILKERHLYRINLKNKELHKQTTKRDEVIIDKQLTIIILLSILSVIFVIIITFLIYNRRKINAQKSEIQAINNKLRDKDKTLSENNIKLRSKDKLKNMFISILSHDLKSPIHSANQLLHFIKEDDSMDDSQKVDILNTIVDSSDNILALINRLLEWSRLQINDEINGNQTCTLEDVISTEVNNINTYNPKNITIETDSNFNYKIKANKQVLSTIIRNLLSNAYKFSNPDDTININFEQTSEFSIIQIKDNGLGMPQDIAKNIFTTKLIYQQMGTANEKGNGIGLKITKMLVDMIDATIEASSEVGKGTTIVLRIPVKNLE